MSRPKRPPTHPVRRLADALGAVYAAATDAERVAAQAALDALRSELGLRPRGEQGAAR